MICRHAYRCVSRKSCHIILHMHEVAGAAPEVPAGLSRRCEREIQSGPARAGRPPAERGRARPAVRRVAHHGGPRRARPAGRRAWSSGAPARAPTSGPPQAPAGAVLRPADPRPRRDGDLRADLPGHDGVAAGARSTRWSGAASSGRRREGGPRLATVPPVHRAPRLRRLLRAARADAGQRRRQPAHRARRSTRPAFPVVLLDRTVVPYPRRGHHDLVGIDNRRAGYVITEHLLRLGARRARLRGACPMPRRPSTRGPQAIARRSIAATSPVDPRARPAPRSRGRRARARR